MAVTSYAQALNCEDASPHARQPVTLVVYLKRCVHAGFEVAATSNAEALNHDEMRAHMHASLFCLAPTGSGWGVRLKFALLSGCIPVIIDDHVRVRFRGLPLMDMFGAPARCCLHSMDAGLFCMAPTGSGWGVRLKFALLSGCIPVIIDDHVRVRIPICSLPATELPICTPESSRPI